MDSSLDKRNPKKNANKHRRSEIPKDKNYVIVLRNKILQILAM